MKNRQTRTGRYVTPPKTKTCRMPEPENELRQLNTYNNMPYHTHTQTNKQSLLKGLFRFYEFNNGLSIRISDAIEQKNAQNTQELMPCISINIVLVGSISYTLNSEKFTLAADSASATCSALILPKKEVITRHLKKGQEIKKINIYVNHEWLKKRCTNDNEYNRLLRGKTCLHQWQATQEQTSLAQELTQMENNTHQHTLRNSITREYKTLHLTSLLLDSILSVSTHIPTAAQPTTLIANNKALDFVERIKQTSLNATHRVSLNRLAETHNISVSTLQRRFKAYCGITVNEYIRTLRLEQAKKAIITDGKSIGEAAYIAGYNHSSNFITAFKKQFHITPKELIKSHRT